MNKVSDLKIEKVCVSVFALFAIEGLRRKSFPLPRSHDAGACGSGENKELVLAVY
jgi:hypothetical protein